METLVEKEIKSLLVKIDLENIWEVCSALRLAFQSEVFDQVQFFLHWGLADLANWECALDYEVLVSQLSSYEKEYGLHRSSGSIMFETRMEVSGTISFEYRYEQDDVLLQVNFDLSKSVRSRTESVFQYAQACLNDFVLIYQDGSGDKWTYQKYLAGHSELVAIVDA